MGTFSVCLVAFFAEAEKQRAIKLSVSNNCCCPIIANGTLDNVIRETTAEKQIKMVPGVFHNQDCWKTVHSNLTREL